MLEDIGELRGDRGLSQVLTNASVRLVACDDVAADRDVDRTSDLDALATRLPAHRGT
jgi:CTP:molybdopterin cytidylyltransferase MocA